MASKASVSQTVDEFIAAVAVVGSRCFDLNSDDGLTVEQQTVFFLLGQHTTLLVQQLTDKFNNLLALAATPNGKKLIAAAAGACDTAKTSCDKLINAGGIPPIADIAAANSNSARAIDLSDDVLQAA